MPTQQLSTAASGSGFPTSGQLSDLDFWNSVAPGMHIDAHPFRGQQGDCRFSSGQDDRISRQIRKEGYFQSDQVISPHDCAAIAHGVSQLAQARVLPVFIAMYDEFWQVMRKLRHTFTSILGASYRLPPDFWAWHIAPGEGSRGWVIHRDAQFAAPFGPHSYVREDGTPRMCTVWIPFTDADTHNSCIYVLPFPSDPAMQSFMRKESVADIQGHEAQTSLLNVRALPARAGSVLGWAPYMLHWGSPSTDWATHARVSVGIYYHAADVVAAPPPTFDDEGRRYVDLHDQDFRLDFNDRLAIVANIVNKYIRNGQMVNEPGFSPAVTEFCEHWKRAQ